MNRLERLVNLIAALLDAERPLTREELRQRVPGYPEGEEAFRRAFERDKESLRSMGIPLQVEAIMAGLDEGQGYRIPRDKYYLPDPGLAPDELAALHLAAVTVRLEGGGGDQALWKLGGASTPTVPDGAVAALPGSEHLAVVFQAIAERRPLTFDYRGSPRTVDPYRIAFRNGHWYMNGRDHGRDAERSFRLDRVDGIPATGDAGGFPRPTAFAARPTLPWEMGDDEEVEARLLVDAEQVEWVLTQLGPAARRHDRPDGSAELTVRVTNRDAFRTFVLGLLEHAEILEPASLRADMVAWLEAVAGAA